MSSIAPDGKVWVCLACGKYTKDRFGNDPGWDTSCMVNSALFDMQSLRFENGRVVKVDAEKRKIVCPGEM